MKKNNILFFFFLISLLISIIISPSKFISAGLNGISAWTLNVLPAVFPFMILSQLLLGTGIIEILCKPFSKVFNKLYKTNSYSPYVFFVSILSGYPVGSKMIADLFSQNKVSKNDAYKMSSFCSNSGPMFIVGAVGIGMLHSSTAGYIILLSHILSAILNGLLYRNLKTKEMQKVSIYQNSTKTPTFGEIVENSCKSILIVGGIIMFFFIIIEFFSVVLSFLSPQIQSVLFGIVEITKGCQSISTTFSLKFATILSSVIITFGGISTAFQSISLLDKIKMPLSLFLLQKFTQCVFAGIISTALCFMLL